MRLANIIKVFEDWAPKWVAWDKDNVGLQIGDIQRNVTKALLALEVTNQVVDEAIKLNAELIITHHPLLYKPLSAITSLDKTGSMALKLAEHKISLFSAHTNLDYTKEGVSFALANCLGLLNVRFLAKLKDTLSKIVVFVPDGHVERVIQAMSAAGAGVIGEYSSCSFRTKGSGSFCGSEVSNPFLGEKGKLEDVEEFRIEMVSPRAIVDSVISAMKAVHPYEEVAYDVYKAENPNPNFGIGALGELPKRTPLKKFLKAVSKNLDCKALKFTGDLESKVQKVAVCGGGGGELLAEAIKSKADVFITADIKYHTFHNAVGEIILIDAGHWETEQVILKPMLNKLRNAVRLLNEELSIFITKHKTNPIQTFIK